MSESIGMFLKSAREEKGYTLTQAAEASGISIAQLSRLENKVRDTPSSDTLRKLAKAYSVSFVELMVRAGHITSNDWVEAGMPDIEVDDLESGVLKNLLSKKVIMENNKNNPDPHEESELSEIPIEKLNLYQLTYKGHSLSKEEADDITELLEAALKRWKK